MNKKLTYFLTTALLLGATSLQAQDDWMDRFSFKGDLRYRHEMIDKEGKDARHRQRIRGRFNVKGKVNDTVSVKMRLATGSDDPVSTNQTLDNGFSTKGIHLDRAYFVWKAADGVKIQGGKMGVPFYKPAKSGLLWDGDLSPEGIALKFKGGEEMPFFFNAGGFWVDEKSSDTDAMLYGAQAGFAFKTDGAKITLGAGYHTFTEAKGMSPFYDAEDSFGNAVDADGNYLYDFNEIEAFLDIKMKLGELPFQIFAHYVVNNDADQDDTGYQGGFKLGKAKDAGTWDFKYLYQELEANAVVGAFCDSDFGGGGTDSTGHRVSLGYAIAKNWKFGLTYFMNEVGSSEKDYKRLQADLKFKF